MLGRLIGLVLAAGLGAAAYAVLTPGWLEGRIPPISLGEYEHLRVYLAGAVAWLALVALAAALRPVEPRRRSAPAALFLSDAALPGRDPFRIDPDQPMGAAAPLQVTPVYAAAAAARPAQAARAELDPRAAGLEPVGAPPVLPDAPADLRPFAFGALDAAAPAPETAPAEPTAAAPAADRANNVVALFPEREPAPVRTFEDHRAALHRAAREARWSEAADVLAALPAAAVTPEQRMLAAMDAGDFFRAQGRLDDAHEQYEAAFTHAREHGDPAGVADALVNLGDVAAEEGRLDAAIGAYEEAVEQRRRVLETAPSISAARRELCLALERLADAREDRGHRMRALGLYRESEAIAARLAAEDPAKYAEDLRLTRERLAELHARLLG